MSGVIRPKRAPSGAGTSSRVRRRLYALLGLAGARSTARLLSHSALTPGRTWSPPSGRGRARCDGEGVSSVDHGERTRRRERDGRRCRRHDTGSSADLPTVDGPESLTEPKWTRASRDGGEQAPIADDSPGTDNADGCESRLSAGGRPRHPPSGCGVDVVLAPLPSVAYPGGMSARQANVASRRRRARGRTERWRACVGLQSTL